MHCAYYIHTLRCKVDDVMIDSWCEATCWPPLRGLMKKEHLVIPDIIGYLYITYIIKISCM